MSTVELWDRFEKTDPAHTKSFQRGGGFKGTSINGTYIAKRLTAEFGPCGKGWRFVLEDERVEEGHTLKNGDRAKVHIVRGRLEYLLEGSWHGTGPQFGQTMLVDENRNGPFTDEEAPKKSVTDCIAKCAVLLGIGADIHLGMFDDNKYVNQRKREEAEAKSDAVDEPQASQRHAEPRGEIAPKPESALTAFLSGKSLSIAIPGARNGKPDYSAWAKAMGKAIAACEDFKTLDRLWNDNGTALASFAMENKAGAAELEAFADKRRDDLAPITETLAAE